MRYEQILRHPYDVIYNSSDVSIDNIDKIALLTEMHLDDDERIGACLYKLLFESQSCYLDFESLQKAVQDKYKSYEINISADRVKQVINEEIKRQHLINDNNKIYNPTVFDYETSSYFQNKIN